MPKLRKQKPDMLDEIARRAGMTRKQYMRWLVKEHKKFNGSERAKKLDRKLHAWFG